MNTSFVVNYRGAFLTDSRYCSRFINLGRPIFPLNHCGASAATVFTIGIAHARCYTHTERATQSATRVGSPLLDSLTVPSTHYVPKNCIYLQSDLSCLYKLNCNIFNHQQRLYFSLHRPASAIRHFFWLVVIAGDKTATSDIQTWPPLTVGLPVTSERYWASFQVTRLFYNATVSQCDHFFCYIWICCLKLHQADYFFNLDLLGEHSAPKYLLFAPYADLQAAENISAFQTSLLLS